MCGSPLELSPLIQTPHSDLVLENMIVNEIENCCFSTPEVLNSLQIISRVPLHVCSSAIGVPNLEVYHNHDLILCLVINLRAIDITPFCAVVSELVSGVDLFHLGLLIADMILIQHTM